MHISFSAGKKALNKVSSALEARLGAKNARRVMQAGRILGITLAVIVVLLFLFRPRGVHTYLVYGVDNYGSLKESGRSDAMMLVRLDHRKGQLSVVSLARDMLISNGRGAKTKINTIVRKNGGDDPEALCEAIERSFGVRPEGWFRINFSSLVSLVDAMGGVEVELSQAEVDYINGNAGYWPGYRLKEGKSRLCGGQALSFVRCRHLDDDLGRGQRQSRFASAMAAEVKHMTPMKVVALFRSMDHAWVSSLSGAEQAGLVWQALWSCRDKMVRLALPFEGTWKYGNANGTSGIVLDEAENRRLLLEAFGEKAE